METVELSLSPDSSTEIWVCSDPKHVLILLALSSDYSIRNLITKIVTGYLSGDWISIEFPITRTTSR